MITCKAYLANSVEVHCDRFSFIGVGWEVAQFNAHPAQAVT